jgi:hypothetical protein
MIHRRFQSFQKRLHLGKEPIVPIQTHLGFRGYRSGMLMNNPAASHLQQEITPSRRAFSLLPPDTAISMARRRQGKKTLNADSTLCHKHAWLEQSKR